MHTCITKSGASLFKGEGNRLAIVTMSTLATKLEQLRDLNTGNIILPDGVKAMFNVANSVAVIHQTPPRIHNLRWAEKWNTCGAYDYHDVRIALPYVILGMQFEHDSRLRQCHCFFRNEPLTRLDDKLYLPLLHNCFGIYACLHAAPVRKSDDIRSAIQTVMDRFFTAGFNFDRTSNWLASGLATGKRDPRMATIEEWERSTAKDPRFILDVKWPTADSYIKTLRGYRVWLEREDGVLPCADGTHVYHRMENAIL